ncbi:MAG: fibronectin type III domain-containing protein [Candidatus Magasanikbacteria bacterium]|nr:fibronectin type III domain-containing protein [Candidatus Magasanikbacteria bacterium]
MVKVKKNKEKVVKPQSRNFNSKSDFAAYWVWHELLLSYGKLRKNTNSRDTKKELSALGKQIFRHYVKNFLYFPVWLFKLLTPSYLKGPVTVWTNLRTILRSSEFRPLRLAVVSQAVFCFVFIRLGMLIFYNLSTPADAATFGWIQTNWSGGVSTTAAGTHSTDRTGWTTYVSSTQLNTTISSGDITISTSSYTTTDDSSLSTDGLASGGGFANGATSSVVVNGGDVTLGIASAGGEINQWDASPYNLPATINGTGDGNGVMVSDGVDAFYILRGGGTAGFYKFIPSDKTTSTLTPVPSNIPPNGSGGSLALSGDYIYVYSGGNSGPKFYAYSILDNSWTTLTNPPSSPYGSGLGSSMVADSNGDIYLAAGGATTGFYKYTISSAPTGTWSTLTSAGGAVQGGSQIKYDATNNEILILTGNNGHTVSRYQIASSTMIDYTGAPNDPGFITGAAMVKNNDNNTVYAISGQNYAWLERLNFNSGTWAGRQTSSTPTSGNVVGYMLHKPGENRIYTTFGGTSFYYLRPQQGDWMFTTTTKPIPGTIGAGATMIRHSNDEIYVLAGGGSSAIYRFAINAGTQYTTTGTLTSATIDLKYATSTRISWSSSAHGQTGSDPVKFQVAANTDNATWSYVGPDGTSGTYFTSSNTALPGSLNGKRYYRYRAYLTTANTSFTPTLSSVSFTYHSYLTSGSLASNPFNAEDDTNVLAAVSWSGTTPTGTVIKFQVRTSPDNATFTSWMGPDGTSATYFTDSTGAQSMPAALTDGEDDRWIQYKVFFESDGTGTPILEQSTLTYVVNAPPEITITNTVSTTSGGIVVVNYDVRDIDSATGATPGVVAVALQYCTASCSSVGNEVWATAATSSLTGTFGPSVSVDTASTTQYTSYSLTWTPTSSYNNQYNGSDFKIRLRANDSEAANNIGVDESNSFVLDTTDPLPTIIIDGRSTVTNTLSISVTDDTMVGLEMKLSNDSDLSSDSLNGNSGIWIPYTTTSTWDLGVGGTTVYYQMRDAYGNVSANGVISSAETPEIPGNLFFKDISNSDTLEWREFIAWQIVDDPTPGFAQYAIYRSSDGINYTEIATQVSRVINYYLDTDIDTGTTYYYKVTSEDLDGNISAFSTIVSDDPNGTGGTDVSAPTISNVTTSSIGSNSITISWETDEVSDSYVDYTTEEGSDFSNVDTVGLTTMRNNAAGLGIHTVSLTNLAPNTTYYFRVRSLDPDGNEGIGTQAPNGYVYTTLTGPIISDVSTAEIRNTEATITWATDQSSDSYVVFSTSSSFAASSTVGSPLEVTSHEVTLPSLIPGTVYYYFVQSGQVTDKNIVEGQYEYYTFETTADLTAPVITFDAGDDVIITDSSLVLTFATDEPATSTILYGTSELYGSSVVNNNLNSDHHVSLTGLLSGTVYYLSIQVSDEDRNQSSALEFTVTTTDSADYTAPIISSVSTRVVTDDEALILWSTDEAATGRVHYGTTSSVYTESSDLVSTYNREHFVTLSGLTTSTEYFYVVVSVDASGNGSTSTEYSFTTLEELSEESEVQLREETAYAQGLADAAPDPDYVAPIISNVTSTVVTDDEALIIWSTDEGATGRVHYGTSASSYTESSDFVSTFNSEHAITLHNLTTSTQYYFIVVSADSSANTTTSSEYTFTTLETLSEESEVLLREETARAQGVVQGSATVPSSGGGGGSSIDRVVPIVSNVVVGRITSDSATITWNTNENANTLVEFGKTTDYGRGSLDLENTQIHSIDLVELMPETVYFYRVSSIDTSGNRSVGVTGSFTTISLVEEMASSTENIIEESEEDVSDAAEQLFLSTLEKAGQIITSLAGRVSVGVLESSLLAQAQIIEQLSNILPLPIIGGQPLVDAGSNYATISWSTDKNANSLVEFAPEGEFLSDRTYDQTVGEPTASRTGHVVEVKGLLPDTVYHYRVVSRTLTGSETKSQDFVFKTRSQTNEITNYNVVVLSPEEVSFSWNTTVPTDSAVVYTPYRNGVPQIEARQAVRQAGLTTQHSLKVAGFEAGVLYDVELLGTDTGNNVSTKVIKGFTTEGEDLAPVISQIQTDAAIVPGGKEKIQIIISWQTNELSTSRLFYRKGFAAEGIEFTASTTLDQNYTKKHVVVVTNFEPGTVYQFVVESIDSSGNTGISKTITILTPQKEQSVFQVIFSNVEDMFSWVGKLRS